MKYFILISLFLFLNFLDFTYSKTVIEPCTTASDPCTAYLSYRLPWDSKLLEIAYRFQLNVTDIFAANSMDDDDWNNRILPGKTVVKIPVTCTCIDGIRRLFSTNYTVKPADTLDSIAEGYGRLVSVDQIKSVNGITAGGGEDDVVEVGKSIVIPLPCTCFNNRNYGGEAVYMSYVVQEGESLSSIAENYGVTPNNLETVNGLGHPQVDLGDILAIPLPACSSANLNWYNESLIVPNGSFALTGNGCIKCSCTPTGLDLQCSPSALVTSCSHLQCKGSNLFIGDVIQKQTPKGCYITACIYRGHTGRKIHRSLEKSTEVQCPGKRSHVTGTSSSTSPSTTDSVLTLSPATSPSPSPSPHMVSCEPWEIPTPKNNTNTRHALYFSLILFTIAVLFLFDN